MDFTRAIPTMYRGVQFKSRMEAQIAFLFDAIGHDWQYEPASYMLDDGTTYQPDFWIPGLRLWVEVRGYTSDRGERQIAGFANWISYGKIALDGGLRPGTRVRWENDGSGSDFENEYDYTDACQFLVIREGTPDFHEYNYGFFGADRHQQSAQLTNCAKCHRWFFHHYGYALRCAFCDEAPHNEMGTLWHQLLVHVRQGVVYIEGLDTRQTVQQFAESIGYLRKQ